MSSDAVVSATQTPIYKRALLKLSGEALMGEQQFGVDPAVATRIALDVESIQTLGVETAIVIGGGNIFRGLAASARGMDRATADYKIGRASCRERVEIPRVALDSNKRTNKK